MPITIVRGKSLEDHAMMEYVIKAWSTMTAGENLCRYLRGTTIPYPKTRASKDILWLIEIVRTKELLEGET